MEEQKHTSRFSNMKKVEEAVSGAPLTASASVAKTPKKKIDRLVYNIDPDLFEAIENSSEAFSSFAKRAMMRIAREEGMIR
jgi:hypothetical protein